MVSASLAADPPSPNDVCERRSAARIRHQAREGQRLPARLGECVVALEWTALVAGRKQRDNKHDYR